VDGASCARAALVRDIDDCKKAPAKVLTLKEHNEEPTNE
jgi:hypothetical protein